MHKEQSEQREVDTLNFKLSTMDIRDLIAGLCWIGGNISGHMATMLFWLHGLGLMTSLRTLYRWTAQYSKTRSALPEKQAICKTMVLDDYQIRILVGWVVSEVRRNKRIYYSNIMTKAKEWFESDVSHTYIRNKCERNGISVKKVNCKGPDTGFTDDQVLQMILDELQEIHAIGHFASENVRKGDLVCLDYITNTIYNRPDRTLQLKGNNCINFSN